MTVQQINTALKNGKQIRISPFDSAWTNQVMATVLSVGDDQHVRYQVDGCESTVSRHVSFSIWRSIQEQAR